MIVGYLPPEVSQQTKLELSVEIQSSSHLEMWSQSCRSSDHLTVRLRSVHYDSVNWCGVLMPILQLELEALAIQNFIIYKNYGYGIWAQVEQGYAELVYEFILKQSVV